MEELKPYNAQERKLAMEYQAMADENLESKKQFWGYPGNEESGLDSFYKWYLESGMINSIFNNAGDPLQPAHCAL